MKELIISLLLCITPVSDSDIVQTDTAVLIQPDYVEMPVKSDSKVKPYMSYTAVTNTDSEQYKLLSCANHESDGTLTVDGYTCVALGQKYGQVGDKFIFTVGGKDYKLIIGDMKAPCDTRNGSGWVGPDGHVIEMIVDYDYLSSNCRILGDCDELMPGKVSKIKKLKN